MKKLLSLIGVAVLSFSLFTGCGLDATKNVEASQKLSNAVQTVNQNAANLDEESLAEFQALSQEISAYGQEIATKAKDFDKQEQIDEVTKKYEEYTKKVKDIAEQNGITIEDTTTAAK